MIYQGDCIDILPTLEANTIQCCVTSPPYYGLRDYGCAGQIGLESTPEAYVEKLVAVFREVRRVLRDDGVLWLNLGDSYAANRTYQVHNTRGASGHTYGAGSTIPIGLKPKDLIGIPWRVAFALQSDGWYLRQDIIWAKPNPMPESVTDRCTKSHEYIFLLTKSARYFYDAAAVSEEATSNQGAGVIGRGGQSSAKAAGCNGRQPQQDHSGWMGGDGETRNRRSVWTITTKPYKEAHFATFPPEIPEICIKAGTSEKGCCPECGAPWERLVERSATNHISRQDRQTATGGAITGGVGKNFPDVTTFTTGWRPTCACHRNDLPYTPIPCTVLDPFSGAGTTGVVAEKLDRKYIGIELNPQYTKLAEDRIYNVQPLFAGLER